MLYGDKLKPLYAIWVPSTGNLRSFSCSTLADGQVTALKDIRDDSVYTVGKLADGNCWMMENLRLDPAGKTLDSSNTNNPTSTFTSTVSALSSSTFVTCIGGSTCYDQLSLGLGNMTSTSANPTSSSQTSRWYSYGGMYNWYTATAGNGTYSKSSGTTDGDLCPSGWHLPTGNTNGEYYNLNFALNNSSDVTNSDAELRKYPANFVYSGYYYNSSAAGRGSGGFYWSSTAGNESVGYYYYYFSSSRVVPGTGYNFGKFNGIAVRCLTD